MNEKATEQTIAELALQYAQEKLNHNTFKAQANEQIMNLEAVLRDKEAEIEDLKQDALKRDQEIKDLEHTLKAYREGKVKPNAVQD